MGKKVREIANNILAKFSDVDFSGHREHKAYDGLLSRLSGDSVISGDGYNGQEIKGPMFSKDYLDWIKKA